MRYIIGHFIEFVKEQILIQKFYFWPHGYLTFQDITKICGGFGVLDLIFL